MIEIQDYLFQGDWEGGRLAALGVKAPGRESKFGGIVDLSAYSFSYPIEHELKVLRVPIPDYKRGIFSHLLSITSFVLYRMKRKEPVLIHCAAGISRSSAATAACLISSGLSLIEARARIKSRWPRSEINPCFLPELVQWEYRTRKGFGERSIYTGTKR